MKYSLSELKDILEPDFISSENLNTIIENVVFDTRRIISPKDSIFFAIKTSRNDGHNFIEDAYNKGIRVFVIQKHSKFLDKYKDTSILKVENTLSALQKLAAYHRKRFDIPVLAITGSNGKTILKEWIYFLLKDEYYLFRSPGSYNSQLGVPLSLLQINEKHRLAIIEAGISKAGEMAKLRKIIRPDIGIFTNLGNAHDSGFKNRNEKLEKKISLFKYCKKIICCADDPDVISKIKEMVPCAEIISWTQSENKDAGMSIKSKRDGRNTDITYVFNKDKGEFTIPFTDKISLRLGITSFLTSLVLGGDKNAISRKTKHLLYPKMRMEIKRGVNNCTLLNDTYNSDIDSIKNALNYIKSNKAINKTLVISDVYQTGYNDNELLDILKKLIEEAGISKLVLVGENIIGLSTKISKEIKIFKFLQTDDVLKNIQKLELGNEFILLKGARKFHFERIFDLLSETFHHTVLEIDLEAISENINTYKSFLKKETKVLAVIKASGYGTGAVKLAGHLQSIGIDYLAVAFLDEAIELRRLGLTLPIMVFNPDLNFIEKFDKYNIEPVIYNFRQLDNLKIDKEFKIHIKLDTGMKRLGFESKDIPELINFLNLNMNLIVSSVFSHLAASNDPGADDFTLKQFQTFEKMSNDINVGTGQNFLKHILNSSGIVRFPNYQMDMVRLGAGMHGIDTSGIINSRLIPANSLKTHISQIKVVKAGEPIGYGMKCREKYERTIAIIPVGYADGLLRQAGNKNYKVWINGEFVPVIADVNMDMSFIDITGITEINEGDEVEIFGKNSKIESLASAGNTIFYEVLSRISPRVKRIYFN